MTQVLEPVEAPAGVSEPAVVWLREPMPLAQRIAAAVAIIVLAVALIGGATVGISQMLFR